MKGAKRHERSEKKAGPNKWGDLPYLTKQQVAEMLQVTPRFLERMVKSGRLRVLKVSRRLVRFRLSDIDAFMSASESWHQSYMFRQVAAIGGNVVSMSGPTGLVVEIVRG